MNRIFQAIVALFVLATVATAAGGPSLEKGKELFTSTSLGTNGRSCAGCHANGKGLEEVANYDEKSLSKIINQCIVKALDGKPLTVDSVELSSLVMYVNSLGAAKAK
ncbi:MAG: hypothetical protein M0023_16195 [Desulfobacteraceae bacterium]|nr:hypothetical protein [Desulfobacteraceae bacterium]